MLRGLYIYSRWDGTQNIFDMDAGELMDRLSNDLLNDGDVLRALRDLMRRGMQDRQGNQMPGVQELLEQLKNQRREQLQPQGDPSHRAQRHPEAAG